MTIQNVAAGRGWQWIVAAFGLFKKNPLIWLVLNMVLFLIGVGLSMLSGPGAYVLYLLTPVFVGGIMTAARDIEAGQDIEIAHLFRGFRQNATHLVTVGGVYLVGQVVISGVMLTIGGPEFREAVQAGVGGMDAAKLAPEALGRISAAVLVGMALFVPLAMAIWFAPALVILDNQPGFRALGASVLGCLRNIMPFLVYGIASFLLLIAAAAPLGLGLILWIPVMMLTLYTSYRDVFAPDAAPSQVAV
jgi:uncharacterized membrane protein